MSLEELKKEFDRVGIWYEKVSKGSRERTGNTIVALHKGDTVYVGIAQLSKKDAFSKKKGRRIALNRAHSLFHGVQRRSDFSFTYDKNEPISDEFIRYTEFIIPKWLLVDQEANND